MRETSYLKVIDDPVWPLEIRAGEVGVVLSNHIVVSKLERGIHRRRATGIKRWSINQLVIFRDFAFPIEVKCSLTVSSAHKLAETYQASATLTVVVQTNPDASLLAAAVNNEDPLTIDASIERLVRQAVARHVQQRLGSVDHDILLAEEARLMSLLDPTEVSVLDGLLVGTRFEELLFHPNEHLAALYRARQKAELDRINALHEQELLDMEARSKAAREVDTQRIGLLGAATTAEHSQMPLDYVIDPELRRIDRENDQRTREHILQPETIKILSHNPDALRAVLPTPPSPFKAPPEHASPAIEVNSVDLQLGADENLESHISAEMLAIKDSIRGSTMIIFEGRDGLCCEAVLVSTDPGAVTLALPALQQRLQTQWKFSTVLVHVVPYRDVLPEFIEGFYGTTAPAQHYGYRKLNIVAVDRGLEYLRIGVHVDGPQRSLNELLRGEQDRRHEQLRRLLAVKRLEIETQ